MRAACKVQAAQFAATSRRSFGIFWRAYTSLNVIAGQLNARKVATANGGQCQTTKQVLWKAEVHRMAGEIALIAAARRSTGGRIFPTCSRRRPTTTSQILGTPRSNEPRAAMA